jgi:hypothetical protein
MTFVYVRGKDKATPQRAYAVAVLITTGQEGKRSTAARATGSKGIMALARRLQLYLAYVRTRRTAVSSPRL